MKKLLLGMMLLLAIATSYSQDTFVRKYTSMISTKNDVSEKQVSANLTVVFNPSGENGVRFHYGNGNVTEYYQTSNLETGKTVSGEEYQLIEIVDKKDGYQITLQLFDKIGVLRLIFSAGNTIEFYE